MARRPLIFLLAVAVVLVGTVEVLDGPPPEQAPGIERSKPESSPATEPSLAPTMPEETTVYRDVTYSGCQVFEVFFDRPASTAENLPAGVTPVSRDPYGQTALFLLSISRCEVGQLVSYEPTPRGDRRVSHSGAMEVGEAWLQIVVDTTGSEVSQEAAPGLDLLPLAGVVTWNEISRAYHAWNVSVPVDVGTIDVSESEALGGFLMDATVASENASIQLEGYRSETASVTSHPGFLEQDHRFFFENGSLEAMLVLEPWIFLDPEGGQGMATVRMEGTLFPHGEQPWTGEAWVRTGGQLVRPR